MKGYCTELSAFSHSDEMPWTSSDFDSSHPYGILHWGGCDVGALAMLKCSFIT
jgi:hypothetical protein